MLKQCGEGQTCLPLHTYKNVYTMRHIDNTMRAQAVMLAMKALDIISKTLDIIAEENTESSPESDETITPVATPPSADAKRETDSHRDSTIRFNKQILRDNTKRDLNGMTHFDQTSASANKTSSDPLHLPLSVNSG